MTKTDTNWEDETIFIDGGFLGRLRVCFYILRDGVFGFKPNREGRVKNGKVTWKKHKENL